MPRFPSGLYCEERRGSACAERGNAGNPEHARAEYPAEHNVGHLYKAKPQLKAFYKATDPTNTLNPDWAKPVN